MALEESVGEQREELVLGVRLGETTVWLVLVWKWLNNLKCDSRKKAKLVLMNFL